MLILVKIIGLYLSLLFLFSFYHVIGGVNKVIHKNQLLLITLHISAYNSKPRQCSGQGVGLVIERSRVRLPPGRCIAGQPRSTQPSIPPRQVNRVPGYWLGLRRGAFTCVGWQVTLCDPIWQVTSRSCEMGVPLTAIHCFTPLLPF